MKHERSASFIDDRNNRLEKIHKRDNSIISNRLNLSTSNNKTNFNNSYISKLSAIRSKVERTNDVNINVIQIAEKERKELQKRIIERSINIIKYSN